jgi:hypothetical protein
LPDAILRRTGCGEFAQGQFFEAFFRKARAEFAPGTAAWLELLPESRVGVVLVHLALQSPLI